MEFISALGYSAMIFGVLKGIAIGLAAGIVLVIILAKTGLLRRNNSKHQLAVKLYYLYIPLLFAAVAGGWMGATAVRAEANSAVEQFRPELTELSVEVGNIVLKDILALDNPDVIKASSLSPLIHKYADTALDEKLGEVSPRLQALVSPVRAPFARLLAGMLESRLLSLASDTLKLDEESIEALWNKGVITVLRQGLVVDIIKRQISQRFQPLFSMLRTFGITLLLPVIIEIFVFRRKKSKA
ncbi:hypothetical protein LJC48_05270 [Desulfovibrio sp. OttesenSCG-928-C06]|nr:hypothetical protein [Desulfovibrio sp. OttesenSCG-928-C06]